MILNIHLHRQRFPKMSHIKINSHQIVASSPSIPIIGANDDRGPVMFERKNNVVILFDIDGTLLIDSSTHLDFLIKALNKVVKEKIIVEVVDETPLIGGKNCSGYTDRQVIESFIDASDLTLIQQVLNDYEESFKEAADNDEISCGKVIDGVEELLKNLVAKNATIVLSTGNASKIAETKLRFVGLDKYFSFEESLGFGTVHNHRDKIVAAAMSPYMDQEHTDFFLAGDTKKDMSGAVANNISGIGVLTGSANEKDLYESGATIVLNNVVEMYSELFGS